jgi:MBG domain (YGX type)
MVTLTNGVLTVNKKAISYTIGNDSHYYGSTTTFSTLATSFLTGVNGETLSIGSYASTGNTVTAHVTTYQITGVVSDGTGLATDYMVNLTNGTLTVNPAAISYTIGNASHDYGSTVNLATVLGTTFSTGVKGENLGITYSSTGNTVTANVGTYPLTGVVSNGTGLTTDYMVTLTNGTLTVNRVHLTVTAVDKTKIYDGAVFSPFTATLSGFKNGETDSGLRAALALSGAAGFGPTATITAFLPGTYTITPTVGTLSATNYDFTPFNNGTLKITYGNCAGGGVILQPINADGTSVFPHAGRTVPVKFYVCDASGNHISDPNVAFAGTGGQLTMLSAVRSQIQTVDENGYSDVPDAAFRWAGDSWIWNMTTNNLQSGQKYTFHINLRDGTFIEFFIAIK